MVARDPEGGLVTYSILTGNQQDHFSIEESTGVVRVNQPLDREDTRLYTLVSSHMKSSLKDTRAEGVHEGLSGSTSHWTGRTPGSTLS